MNEILGYKKNGDPIYPSKPGMVYTQAVISCIDCHKYIRSNGGPMWGARCVPCYVKNVRNPNDSPSS